MKEYNKKGNPFKRGNTWTFIYYVKDENGKRIQKWKGGYATKKEAEADLKIYKAKAELNMLPVKTNYTLETYLDSWFAAHKKTLQPSTINGYYGSINNHIIPELGKMKLKDIKPSTLQNFYMKLIEEKGLKASSVRFVHSVLKTALKSAVNDELIMVNPCSKVKLPKMQKHKSVLLSAEQLHQLFDYLDGTEFEVEIKLACLHGLRKGEVLGLMNGDIDFVNHTMRIERQVSTIRDRSKKEEQKGYGIKDLKSESSHRTLEMSEETERLIRLRMERNEAQKKELGEYYEDNQLICCNPDGTVMNPYRLYHGFKKALKACNLPEMRFHDLRHSYATLCIDLDVPLKVISQALGHATTAITAEVYADSIKAKKELAEKISKAITSE